MAKAPLFGKKAPVSEGKEPKKGEKKEAKTPPWMAAKAEKTEAKGASKGKCGGKKC